ncbi:hypothetical protein CB1_064113015 [Camelus ferus]|nr:hypothetical protein CB1_064113015 [Camelus ferus]
MRSTGWTGRLQKESLDLEKQHWGGGVPDPARPSSPSSHVKKRTSQNGFELQIQQNHKQQCPGRTCKNGNEKEMLLENLLANKTEQKSL